MRSDRRPTILIVDDDRFNRRYLADLLRDEYRLLLAKDGPSGLAVLNREEVHLVLLDISMPGMDGYEVLRHIRAEPGLRDLSVVFITGMASEADEEKGLLLGAADYVQKPIRPAIVRARIRTHIKLAMQRLELEQLALQDGLTGIANRRYFDKTLERTVRQFARSGQSLGVAMFDVDHFKQYNDRYGHGAGDAALKRVAAVLGGFARRAGDMAARYGGEEFVLLLAEVREFPALLERLRQAVAAERIKHERSPTSDILSISGGAVLSQPGAATTGSGLIEAADQLLYRAKRGGRNRILFRDLALAPVRQEAERPEEEAAPL